jgi:hypothetical protein
MSWRVALGCFTLVGLFGPEAHTFVRTVLLVQALDAIMCRVFAVNNGYPKNLWTVLGFVFGIWAVAVLILLPRRHGATEESGTR